MRDFKFYLLLTMFLLVGICGQTVAFAGPVVPQYTWIPFSDKVSLEANIYYPEDAGPHPLAILSHGRAGTEAERKTVSPGVFEKQAQWFVERGFAVVVPVRRAYGKSGGEDAEYQSPYNPYKSGLAGVADLKAVVAYMTRQKNVDPRRLLLVGQSVGGLVSIAAASQQLNGLVGVIDFAGGYRKNLGNLDGDRELFDAFSTFGRTAKVPTLWLFTPVDNYFPPYLADGMFQAFTKAGGNARMIGLASDLGHSFFYRSSAIAVWEPYVTEFLVSLGLVAN
ncbi:MAG: dienelactone hydrolase family protein [Negativicutes bacterium]|nr:dienelactone hydrolase family protein [Negativicutes bacterium]